MIDDILWALLLLTNTGWAMYVIYILIMVETKEDTWQPMVLSGKKAKAKAKPVKEKIVQVESQELLDELKKIQKQYEKDKIQKDVFLKEAAAIQERHEEERAHAEHDLERLSAKYTEQKQLVTTLQERIHKYGQRGAIVLDRMKLNKEVITEDDKQLKKLQEQVEEAKLKMEKANDDSAALKKAKGEVNSRLKSSSKEVSQLTYTSKGLTFKIHRLTDVWWGKKKFFFEHLDLGKKLPSLPSRKTSIGKGRSSASRGGAG
eukprot:TRINITY_DN222_c2_g1_i2.p1 TRINITY_DN222_c2_g1~~TRINITY_DN222_c2_g1_i2.p1  ORF type:complete len:260 (+),score=60.38 TRINITY_DN222_c2_g1_i2:3-782(+)